MARSNCLAQIVQVAQVVHMAQVFSQRETSWFGLRAVIDTYSVFLRSTFSRVCQWRLIGSVAMRLLHAEPAISMKTQEEAVTNDLTSMILVFITN